MTVKLRWRGACAGLAALLLSVLIRKAWAGDPEVPSGTGPLPDFAKGARGGALVTSQHVQSYRSVLPKEIADLVEHGELAFEAVRAPREPIRFVRSAVPAAQGVSLGSQGELLGFNPQGGLPATLFALSETVQGDAKKCAFEALWNVATSMWRHKAFATQLSMYIFQKADATPHKVEFLLERIHPLSLGTVPGTLKPVFREKVAARKPAAIQVLAWLTLRFFGTGEDFVWVASPVNRSIRQITGSNRSDSIFSGAFSPDDLFVWSGKVELVDPVSVSLVPLLVPIIEAKEQTAMQQGGCSARVFAGDAAVSLNTQTTRFKEAAGWVPSNTLMALRNLLKVEMVSRDPFSLDMRQVIYIDQNTGLPVYRMVWDQAGRLRKVTMGIVRVLDGKPEEAGPFLAGAVVIYVNEGRRLALISDTLTQCDQYVPGRALEDFDPSSFVRFEQPVVEQKKLEATPEAEDSHD